MPTLNVEGFGMFEVEEGKRLVLALEDNGVDVLHRCGGYARCTTCRVEFIDGEPNVATEAEETKLKSMDLWGEVRLSCQIVCDHDMSVRAISRLENSGLSDPGPRPEEHVTPVAEWHPIDHNQGQ